MGKKSTPKSGSKEAKTAAEGSSTNAKLNAIWSHEAHIKYRLSDREFVSRGWTKLPQEVAIQKITTYKTFSAKPHMLLFKKRRRAEYRYYPDGTKAAVFKPNGSGSIYYPSGRVAIHCHNGIYIVLSPGGKDPLTGFVRAQVVTALFDMLGNGVVYDNEGCVVLNFTQKLGVLEGTQNGLPMKWTWPVRIREDESVTVPESQKLFYLDEESKEKSETKVSESSKQIPSVKSESGQTLQVSQSEGIKKGKKKAKAAPRITAHHSMPTLYEVIDGKVGEEEGDGECSKNSLEETSHPSLISKDEKESIHSLEPNYAEQVKCLKAIQKKHARSKCVPIKPILRRLNEYMSLRILDQANVSLTFSAKARMFRLELGVVIDPSEILQVNRVVMKETISVDGVVNYFEQFPNHSLERVLSRLMRQRDWSSERMRERLRIAKRCGGSV